MESRVRNHSGVGHGQATGGAEVRGRLASIRLDSSWTLALFCTKAEIRRQFNSTITFLTDHESLNCEEFFL
jgi:hypothetical protein